MLVFVFGNLCIYVYYTSNCNRRAADEMQDSPTSIMLKYLQVLNNISTKNNRTVVVPIPKALLQPHVWRGRAALTADRSTADKVKILQATVATVVPVLQELIV